MSLVLFGEAAAAPASVLAALGLAFALFSLRTSMTRHVLFPAGESHIVMTATLIATALGVPAMIGLTYAYGPIGAAIGYALTEAISTLLLIRRTARAARRLSADVPA